MILVGTIVNALGVLGGGAVGLAIHRLLQKGIPQRYSDRIMQGIGLCTVYIAAGGLLSGSKTLVTILSMVAGAAIGEWLGAQSGLGYFSRRMMTQLDGAGVFAPIVLLAATAMIAVALLGLLERRVVKWRGER